MAYRMIAMVIAAVMLFATNNFGQDAKKVASPSDVPVDQIKKATATQDAATQDAAKPDATKADAAKTDAKPQDAAKTDAAKTDAAKTDAAKTDAAKTDAAKTDDSAPKPVAEGTPVAQPDCGATTSSCNTCNTCDPCSRKGRLMGRVRSLFSRRCCR